MKTIHKYLIVFNIASTIVLSLNAWDQYNVIQEKNAEILLYKSEILKIKNEKISNNTKNIKSRKHQRC